MADNHLVNVCECFILQIPKFEIPLQFLTRRSQPSALSFSPGKLRVSFVSSMQSRHLQVTEKQLNGCVSSANARMAESVDALVSNTSGAIRAGSIPAPGTRKWPTDTCRPFLYKIFPTFSPHLPIILQKVFRKRPISSEYLHNIKPI